MSEPDLVDAMLTILGSSCPSTSENDVEVHFIQTHCVTFKVLAYHPAPGEWEILNINKVAPTIEFEPL